MININKYMLQKGSTIKIPNVGYKKYTTSNAERRKELESYLKYKNYPDYVDILNDMIDDPKTKALLNDSFGGKLGNLKLKFSAKTIKASRLMPSQQEICLDISLKFGLKEPQHIDDYFDKEAIIKRPIVTFNDNYIVDGHHRWAQIFFFNPNADIAVFNYSGNLSPIQMLKITQGAIAADPSIEDLPVSHPHGKSLYDVSDVDIKKYIDNYITDEVIQGMIDKVNSLTNRDDVIEYLTNNALNMKYNHTPITNAPPREIMPQTSKSKGKNNESESALKRMANKKVYKI